MPGFSEDVAAIKPKLKDLPLRWEGKASILDMKQANYYWKMTEWWAFYFELLCKRHLCPPLTMPGEKIGKVQWDAQLSIHWDLKAKAIKSDSQTCILNDEMSTRATVADGGELGLLIALCDVEYNDVDRSFQRWRTELQGGKSKYTLEREQRTSNSRYRKTLAVPVEALFIRLTARALEELSIMAQGRNSNGRPRPKKFMFDLERHAHLIEDRQPLGRPLA